MSVREDALAIHAQALLFLPEIQAACRLLGSG